MQKICDCPSMHISDEVIYEVLNKYSSRHDIVNKNKDICKCKEYGDKLDDTTDSTQNLNNQPLNNQLSHSEQSSILAGALPINTNKKKDQDVKNNIHQSPTHIQKEQESQSLSTNNQDDKTPKNEKLDQTNHDTHESKSEIPKNIIQDQVITKEESKDINSQKPVKIIENKKHTKKDKEKISETTNSKPKIDSDTIKNKPNSNSNVNNKKVRPAIKKSDSKPASKPAVKPAVKPDVKPAVKTASKPAVKPAVKPDVKPDVKPAVKPASKRSINQSEQKNVYKDLQGDSYIYIPNVFIYRAKGKDIEKRKFKLTLSNQRTHYIRINLNRMKTQFGTEINFNDQTTLKKITDHLSLTFSETNQKKYTHNKK